MKGRRRARGKDSGERRPGKRARVSTKGLGEGERGLSRVVAVSEVVEREGPSVWVVAGTVAAAAVGGGEGEGEG